MGIFDRLRHITQASPAPTDETSSKSSKADATTESKTVTMVSAPPLDVGQGAARLLLTPWVSEKAATLASAGTYVFRIPTSANRLEVAKAVEALYKVKVEAVRTVRGQGKITRRGRIQGRRVAWKKALVTLKQGQKIDLYQGV